MLDETLNSAIDMCEGKIPSSQFSLIYPFTTENISGYINRFELENKSLLTVGSSGDQIINAILAGCKDITLIDINKFSLYYYYLKISCLISLSKEEFMKFLRFNDYPKVFKDNKDVFDKNIFEKVKENLKLLDYESYLFWNELFKKYDSQTIRKSLFSDDENRTYVIEKCNPYLIDDNSYKEISERVFCTKPKFTTEDIFKAKIERKFDNIWLSNIGTYLPRRYVKIMTDKMSSLLSSNGQLLISYLYSITKDTEYQDDWCLIYDLERTFKILSEYNPELISFIGVDGIKFNDTKLKDSTLIYRKI